MKAYLWSTNNGNASWTVNGRQGTQQGEWQNHELFLFLFLFLQTSSFHDSSFMVVDTAV